MTWITSTTSGPAMMQFSSTISKPTVDERADDSNVSRGIGPLDDFGVSNDSVFINDFGINSRMCALMNSASAVEQDHADDFWVDND